MNNTRSAEGRLLDRNRPLHMVGFGWCVMPYAFFCCCACCVCARPSGTSVSTGSSTAGPPASPQQPSQHMQQLLLHAPHQPHWPAPRATTCSSHPLSATHTSPQRQQQRRRLRLQHAAAMAEAAATQSCMRAAVWLCCRCSCCLARPLWAWLHWRVCWTTCTRRVVQWHTMRACRWCAGAPGALCWWHPLTKVTPSLCHRHCSSLYVRLTSSMYCADIRT